MVTENACDANLNLCYYTAFFATNNSCSILIHFLELWLEWNFCQGHSYQNVTYCSRPWHLWLSLNRGYLIANVNSRGEFSIRKGYWGWWRQCYQAFCYRAGLSYWEKCPYRGLSHLGQCYHWRRCSTTLCSCLRLCNCQDRSRPGAWSCPVLQCRSSIPIYAPLMYVLAVAVWFTWFLSHLSPPMFLIGELSQVHSKKCSKKSFN